MDTKDNMSTTYDRLSPKQKEAVDLRNCNILVSAAAGSGKTRVLVERILSRITDRENPVDIDSILVLTFTKAAAGEMKERIAAAIRELADRDDADERVKRQAALVYNAEITTIDSFCLNIIRNNFAEIGLEPGFKVINENEAEAMADEILDEVMEEILASEDIPHLNEYLDRFESKDSLRKIRQSIITLYKEADKAPFPEDYIEERRRDYKADSIEELKGSRWFGLMWEEIKDRVTNAYDKAEELLEACESAGPEEYVPVCMSDLEQLKRLVQAGDYEALGKALEAGIKWDRLPTKTSCAAEYKEAAKDNRNLYKDLIKTINNTYYKTSLATYLERMKQTDRVVNALADIVLKYYRRLEEEKRERGLMTFSDIEHMALRILLKKGDGGYVPTQVALDYRNTYSELMIDEYQDSNYTQEWILGSISGESEGLYDRFMVGDVKQSIYRFRNANPELFIEKYDAYSPDEGPLKRIDLSTNYRSRKEVLGFVNAVFEGVMDKAVGGVDYNEDNRLNYGGGYGESGDVCTREYKTELMLLQKDAESEYSREEQEAMLIAARIRRLRKEQLVKDNETGGLRPCRFSDIVILMRSIPHDIDSIRRVYEAEGIPVHTTLKGGYFDTLEIMTVLNYLSILDNPHNDIPMYGALKSVFGDLSEEEICKIRLAGEESLYDGLMRVAHEDISADTDADADTNTNTNTNTNTDIIRQKVRIFLKEYADIRAMVPYTPIYKLLRIIYERYDYVEYVSALPGGEQRKANVSALLSKAESFEKDGFRGIFDFCRYIERLHKYESDEGEVQSVSSEADVVRIMTMHKSKGLEFPVCILAGLHKRFNMSDSKEELIFHGELGIGLDSTDSVRRVRYKDMRKAFIASRIKRDSISEELRVLYVAMTRAKEKLILSSITDDMEKALQPYSGKRLSVTERMSIGSFYEVLRRTRGENDWNGQCDLVTYNPENIISEQVNELNDMGSRRKKLEYEMTQMSEDDMRAVDIIRDKLSHKYPHKDIEDLYTKTSVSELKMSALHDGLLKGEIDDIPDEFFGIHDEEEYVPDFIRQKEDKRGGTAIGSAYHRVMELIDMAEAENVIGRLITDEGARDEESACEALIHGQMETAIKEGRLLREDYLLVDRRKIVHMLLSDLGRRMQKAATRGELYREKPFVLGISAGRLKAEYPEDEMVLIQGIIDVFFEEDGSIILLDYKTDRVKNEEELKNRYITQLDYYEEALARITGKPVSERLLYSFALERVISC